MAWVVMQRSARPKNVGQQGRLPQSTWRRPPQVGSVRWRSLQLLVSKNAKNSDRCSHAARDKPTASATLEDEMSPSRTMSHHQQ